MIFPFTVTFLCFFICSHWQLFLIWCISLLWLIWPLIWWLMDCIRKFSVNILTAPILITWVLVIFSSNNGCCNPFYFTNLLFSHYPLWIAWFQLAILLWRYYVLTGWDNGFEWMLSVFTWIVFTIYNIICLFTMPQTFWPS